MKYKKLESISCGAFEKQIIQFNVDDNNQPYSLTGICSLLVVVMARTVWVMKSVCKIKNAYSSNAV
jgi:hypothetical protein